MVMTVYVIHLLFFGSRTRMAFYDEPPMQVFEPVKQ